MIRWFCKALLKINRYLYSSFLWRSKLSVVLLSGASDDGAGCAVLLEVMRALAATSRPLRHLAVFLFNGAEENIMQASHAFITQHK